MPANFKNLVEVCEQSCEKFKNRELFGEKRNGSWEFISYGEFQERVAKFRAGLAALGVTAGDRIAIIAGNSIEWAVAAYATYGLRAAFVPMYEPQPADEWVFILNDCSARVVITSTREIFDKLQERKVEVPSLEHVIGIALPETDSRSFAAVSLRGEKAPMAPLDPAPGEIAGFIYTSGTTGMPKGVVLTHANFCSNVNAIDGLFPLSGEDRSLAFLPWAHAFGQTAELHSLLSQGLSIAINDEVPNLVGNLSEVRPTVLIAVPRIFNRIYDGINKQMLEKPAPIRALFRAGVRAATLRARGESPGFGGSLALALADTLIFKKVRARVGGRLRFAVSGSAALSTEVAEFVDALGIEVFEGYGLSEASPVVTTNYHGNRKIGSVGKPIPGVRIVIDTDVTGDPVNGEIVIYGDNVMQGYHNRPEENAQAFTADRGLRTGDMGRLDEDGYLYITGRIKEQYKLENGKYVVPSPLEEILKLSPYILNVMLQGENKPYNVALVVVDTEAVMRWAKLASLAVKDVVNDPQVRTLIQTELENYGARFRSYERPKKFVLVTEDFTVENGLLTPSLKVKRRNVLTRYGKALEALYST
jgi:long-chain acyl-CoA synthetase